MHKECYNDCVDRIRKTRGIEDW